MSTSRCIYCYSEQDVELQDTWEYRLQNGTWNQVFKGVAPLCAECRRRAEVVRAFVASHSAQAIAEDEEARG